MANKRKWFKLTALSVVLIMLASVLVASCFTAGDMAIAGGSLIREFTDSINTGRDNYLDSSLVYRLPDTVKESDKISIIIRTDEVALLDAYQEAKTDISFAEYASGEEGERFKAEILDKKEEILADLDKTSIDYVTGADYSAILSGFEVTITAKDFETLCKTIGDRGTAIVGEVYAAAETQLVENDVNFYENTGIFDSSDFAYDGTGVVVAVLDTGLDYYHSAFSLANFTADKTKLALTYEDVVAALGDTKASTLKSGLTASDVFINQKVPFGFDYADKDSEVYPLSSEHGTHVSGVIAGKDDTITGVAPNAQLVEMKIFSDVEQSARTSWILNALEDCVVLGVDVINMSIGTSAGFSRATDKEAVSGVYDKIRDAGISLVVAASNSFNSTYGSEKNGNLGLTSNPDSGTVGSPSTYEGALSIASISGVKTPYLLFNGTIIYFTESTDRFAEEKYFVEEILAANETTKEFEYVTIPGAGRKADYTGIDIAGKIALVRRGSTTFEEKANVAAQLGAAGLIVYNNVAGEIKMNVGDADIAVASIRQDDGELLAAQASGTIKISRTQTSGPFMSDFSSWGPTPDLRIKPELTAHGGSILSAVPGQSYDRQSGTSMACPNVAGVVTLLRQYLIENYPELANDRVELAARINQLLMSTADIVINTNGLPYSVRKQGAGLANLNDSAATRAYIQTYDRITKEIMNKSKIELGDDPDKTGVYTLKFSIVNFGTADLTYDVSAYVMTEGVSETLTVEGKTTVDEQGYILDGASVVVSSVSNGTQDGSKVTVAAGKTADVTVTITLSDSDKEYLNNSFENGMYVEGFLMFKAVSGTKVDMNVPYLAYYGDWTTAPIFDLDYFATNADELDDSIDLLDKTLPDAYATRPIGGLSSDYVSYLGSFYFQQDPASTNKIAADPKYISLTNQTDGVNSLRFVWAGLLRNAARVEVSIVEDATGEEVYHTTDHDVRKSYGDGGSIYPANIDIEFSAIEHNLKNNTAYTVNIKAYVDYGDGGEDSNVKNEFSFPLVTDFSAPVVTDCEFYTEYDRAEKETRYFARIAVYDNHYAMGMQVGYVGISGSEYTLNTFDTYIQPIYSDFNSTTYVVYELTDHINQIKKNAVIPGHENTITIACYDYALNQATYEIELPDTFEDVWFVEEEVVLSPNEVYTIKFGSEPSDAWTAFLDLSVTKPNGREVARVINNKILAIESGECRVRFRDPTTGETKVMNVKVLAEGEKGYVKKDKPVVDDFRITGYHTDKAFYQLTSDDRDLGMTDDNRTFSGDYYSLTMYPSESVTLQYVFDPYFPSITNVVFESGNENLVTVDANGKITAVAEGYASVTVRVMMNGKATYYTKTINIEIKDPFITSGPTLTQYFGAGNGNSGVVTFPQELAINAIGQFAFSNYDYVDKGEGDEISEENPDYTKIWFIGNNDIKEVIIPEGVESIGPYAFANLTALTRVVLPSTLKTIDYGAFYGCTALQSIATRDANGKVVEGLINAQFINRAAFSGTALRGELNLGRAVAIADEAFALNKNISKLTLSSTTQSIGADAFYGNTGLKTVIINADKLKLGAYVFGDCTSLTSISINAAVIPASAFDGCTQLTDVTIGKDVAVIGEYAFRGTAVTEFTVAEGNTTFFAQESKPYILNANGTTILLVAPGIKGAFELNDTAINTVGYGAFSGVRGITSVTLPGVTVLENYAFAGCSALTEVNLNTLTCIGDYAFFGTALTATPSLSGVSSIGAYAFAESQLTSVTIPDGMTIGESAFRECQKLASVTIGNNVIIGANAFRLDRENNYFAGNDYAPPSSYELPNGQKVYYYTYTSALNSLTIGDHVSIGNGAFYGASKLVRVTLGEGAIIGDEAFYNADSLRTIDLSKVISIGAGAFYGDVLYEFEDSGFTTPALGMDGYYLYRYYAPDLTEVDLSSLEYLGEDAFSCCTALEKVTLGAALTTIHSGAFNGCTKLSSINLSAVQTIGEDAFYETALTQIDLSSATLIEKYAFVYNEELTSLILNPNGVELMEGAFAYCSMLSTVDNLNKVTYIDSYAFAYTAITEADLSSVTFIGEQAFLKNAPTAFKVTLSECLADIGDNPFGNCILAEFTSTASREVNGKIYTEVINTYPLGEKVCVINGSLYRIVPNGYELITFAGDDTDVIVADRTVRISAMAFAGTGVKSVVLPYTVASIGHKAFYGCTALNLINFQSYHAPILEEEYDINYFYTFENLPATGEFTFTTVDGEVIYNGLGIVPYFMWNVSDLPSNAFYGANFVDYIGHINSSILMVRPSNGKNYDSFIFDQYFNMALDGASAADKVTLAAIAAINALPDTITLNDEDLVNAARAAYNKIAGMEQRALVLNFQKLSDAEKRIAVLKELKGETEPDDPNTEPTPGDPSTEPSEPTEPEPAPAKNDNAVLIVSIIVIAVVELITLALVAILLFLLFKGRLGRTGEETLKESEPNAPIANEDASVTSEPVVEAEPEVVVEAEDEIPAEDNDESATDSSNE